MSEAKPTADSEQGSEQNTVSQRVRGADWTRYGALALAAIIGLLVNAALVAAFTGGGLGSLAEGVAYLTPAVALAAILHDAYNPLDVKYVSPTVLFLTLLAGNTMSLSIRVFRMGVQTEPLWSVAVLAIVALIFTPGAFLGTWAARRWWL